MLVVFPARCPDDGVVIEGHGKMVDAFLTGEAFGNRKGARSRGYFRARLTATQLLTMRANKVATSSRYTRIMLVIRGTGQHRPRLRRLGDRFGAWYTPVAVALSSIAPAVTREPQHFLAVLVVATPCPLLISIPVAIIGAISLCARRGIIIKNPAVLEEIRPLPNLNLRQDRNPDLRKASASPRDRSCAWL